MSRAGDARAEVLARIGDALRAPVPDTDVPRGYRQTGAAGIDAVELFAERVADYRATVMRAIPTTLSETIATLLRDRRVRVLVTPAGLPDGWLELATVERLADDPPLGNTALDAADGVITTCAVAIAETGTIVLDAGPGQGRRALSLLPDYHVCVVRTTQIVGDVPDAIRVLDPRRPLTWISGPSATSDIELERIEGVHGPRTLDVVLLDDGPVVPTSQPLRGDSSPATRGGT